MSRRRKEKKRKEKRLERIPEKLQRKRERRERYRVRRTPRSVTYGLVVSLLIVIIVAAWILIPRVPPEPPEPELGTVHILQEDTFYVYIGENGSVNVLYMHGRYGAGTQLGEMPLNLTITRDFGESQVNFTFPDLSVYYDYFGNAYNIVPNVESDSYEYILNDIYPTFLLEDNGTRTIGHEEMKGHWAVFWDYFLNSSQNRFLAQDDMSSLFNFTFSITPENGTLIYNTPTIVHCNITFHNPPDGTNVYNYGKVRLVFPKQVYNESTLLANITLANVERIGSRTANLTLPYPNVIDNATHIEFNEDPFDISLSQDNFYGYIFDLNVTAFTNSSFILLDLTTPGNEYFLQSGETLRNDPQPLYYPFSDISVHTDRDEDVWLNVTNLYFSFPQVWVEVNSTPGPGPAISLYMPKTPSKHHVFQNSYFELKETSTSVQYPLVSSDSTQLGTPFQVPLETVRIRRLTWI
ncbi:MAG: hypothetical protein Q6364_05095 [Candidatus Hermodarchaeota archaeon]|nr:hypothetical protein [Candidatus Hermodarchaeota archaeon]